MFDLRAELGDFSEVADLSQHNPDLWKQIMEYDLSIVTATFAHRNPEFRDQAEVLEKECRRFLYLAAVVPHLEHAPTKPIDEYWHTFILFTREYTNFCEKVIGKYLHHKPLGAADHQAVFDRTQQMITGLFGNFKNSEFWMMPAPATSCCSALDVDKLAA